MIAFIYIYIFIFNRYIAHHIIHGIRLHMPLKHSCISRRCSEATATWQIKGWDDWEDKVL